MNVDPDKFAERWGIPREEAVRFLKKKGWLQDG